MGTTLNVCLDEEAGQVWFAEGDLPPVASTGQADAFACSPEVARADSVRVPGDHLYGPLILRLLHRQALSGVQVYLCRSTSAEKPGEVLWAMRQHEDAPSRGGCLLATGIHQRILAAAQDFRDLPSSPSESELEKALTRCRYLLEDMPAYKVLALAGEAYPEQIAALLAVILDPRLYVDPREPDDQDWLEKYLGLSLEHQDRMAVPERLPPVGRLSRKYRCGLVDAMWTRRWSKGDLNEAAAHFPRYFLSMARVASEKEARLNTSRRLIGLLRRVWLDMLSPGRAEPLYDPKIFFERDAQAQQAFSREVIFA